MDPESTYRFTISLDAQGSSRVPDPEKPTMRRHIYEVSGRAFTQARIDDAQLSREDRGDGILAILETSVPPVRIVGEWVEYLHEELRAVNGGLRHPLRLRAGITIGPVTRDRHGWSGSAVELACRIGDSGTAKELLAAAPDRSCLAVVASDTLYDDVVRRGGRWVEPERYRRYVLDLKEGPQPAWIQVLGLERPPALPQQQPADEPVTGELLPPETAAPARPRPAAEPQSPTHVTTNTIHNHGNGRVVSDVEHIEHLDMRGPADGGR
ncbi:hypothetical protein [Streptomyces synnematoformans]|uniref:Guanylate cyclase domain-containing protein n=1 Tax=Streptomyces synnematoformans TaxID=415721 RepID=A0ABP5KT46_9ACTN